MREGKARNPKTKLSAQRIFICPRGTESRNKGQRQEIKREKGKGQGTGERRGKGERGGAFVPEGNKMGTKDCLWIERRQMCPQVNDL